MRYAATTESASHYLSPPAQYFWRWGDGGEVFTWADGSTIAFRDELLHALDHMSTKGLPPLGAVLLVMAACRENWNGDGSGTGTLNGLNRIISQLDLHNSALPEAWLPQIVRTLDEIHKLPRDIRTLPHYKNALIALVFESTPARIAPENAGGVLRLLSDGFCPEPGSHDAASLRLRMGASFQQDMQCLHGAFMKVNFQALEHRLRTGLAAPPDAADVELPSVERVGDLLTELAEDHELGGLVRLARNLMALTYLPRKMSEPEDSSAGGVSDISNRGSLDRLLVSELAHDDLTLAIRVAVNEALYLRRESPPRAPLTSRMILLDTGIRLWGLPRVFATSAALAFTASLAPGARVQVHRPVGRAVEIVDLASRAGLTTQLESLAADAHPSAALPAWIDAWRAGPQTEALVITHEQVLRDPAFRSALATLSAASPIYVATVAATGDFGIHVVQGTGVRLLRSAQLDLERLLAPPAKAPSGATTPDLDPVRHDWPAGLLTDRFPLRLPFPPRYGSSHYREGVGLATATQDRRLLIWDTPGLNARELTCRLPAGQVKWLRVAPDGTISLLAANRAQGMRLFVYSLPTDTARTHELDDLAGGGAAPADSEIQGVFDHAGCLYVVYREQLSIYDKSSGTFLDVLKVEPGVQWKHDRFFVRWTDRTWHMPTYDGRKASWQVIPQTNLEREPREDVRAMFDRAGHDGPWALLSSGRVASTLGSAAPSVVFASDVMQMTDALLAVSPDGNRLIVMGHAQGETKPKSFLLDLETVKATALRGKLHNNLWHLEPAHAMTYGNGLQRRFTHVVVTPDGDLGLAKAGRDEVWMFTAAASVSPVSLQKVNASPTAATSVPFEPCEPPDGMSIGVRAATWDDGSRVILDSRGILHVESAEPALGSMSIALADPAIAAWTSDGEFYGPKAYIGDVAPMTTDDFLARLRAFTGRLRWSPVI